MNAASVAAQAGLYALVLMLSAPAAAQTTQPGPAGQPAEEAGRELSRLGLEAVASGDFWSAEERLTEAIALRDSPTLRLGRARARRGLGRLMSAADDYQAVLRARLETGRSAANASEQAQAQSELAALEPAIPRLRVDVVGGSALIKVGGVQWPADAQGRAQPIDPGDYVIEAVLPSGEVLARSVTIDPGRVESVRFDLTLRPTLGEHPATSETLRPSAPASQATKSAASAASTQRDDGAGQRRTGYVVGAAALATAIAATITAIVAVNRHAEFDAANADPTASMSRRDALRSRTRSMQWISTGLTSAAVIAGGLSVYLLVSAHDDGPARAHASEGSAGVHSAWQPAFGVEARAHF